MRERFRTTTLKARLIVSAIVVVLVVLVLSLFLLVLNTETVDINNTSSSDIEYLPVMPGAFDMKPEERATRLWKGVEFKVRMKTADIRQFYETELPARGWLLKSETPINSYMPSQDYRWEDKKGRTPYILIFSVTVESSGDVSLVSENVDRIPILNETPLYPGAQDVEKKQQCIHLEGPSSPCEIPETLITYTVQAPRQNIDNYYNDTLAQYGWSYGGEAFDNSVNADIKGSLVFRWGIGGVERAGVGASVTVLAREIANGPTEVDLDLRGTNKYSP